MCALTNRETWRRISALLDEAFELQGNELDSFLAKLGAESPAIRDKVEAMLKADARTEGMLDEDFDAFVAPLLEQESDDIGSLPAGTTIGNYRIVSEVGHGGMGRVYAAERADGAFDQKVALKVIRAGMSWGALRDRFLQERQILASLDHPNLARLLDGGVTEDGRPYFVMEYVDGRPITEFVADRNLTLRQRLELFTHVCGAVAHAQRRLVVHRDLKPSNILVNTEGEVKLLDFGIARMLGVSEEEGLTQLGPRLLTPEYAAPEQIHGGTITTAADVFALGCVLSEVVASPGDEDGRIEIPRDIRRIIDKARSEDPELRYAAAAELGEDIGRFLAGFPINARPPSLAYVADRFIKRNKLAVGAAVVVLFTLVAGIIATSWQAQRAELAAAEATTARLDAESARAETQSVNTVLLNMLASASPINDGKDVRVVEVLQHAENEVRQGETLSAAARTEVLITLASTYLALRELDDAERILQGLIEDPLVTPGSDSNWRINNLLADVYIERRDWPGAIAQSEYALELAMELDPSSANVLESEITLAQAFSEHHEPGVALNRLQKALESFPNGTPDQVGRARLVVGRLHEAQGRQAEAQSQYERAADAFERAKGAYNANTIVARAAVASMMGQQGQGPQSAAMLREQLEIATDFLGPDHKTTFTVRMNLGAVLAEFGETAEALEIQRGVYASSVRAFGVDGLLSIISRGNMATQLVILGQRDEAESIYRDNIERLSRAHPDEYNYRLIQAFNLAELLNEYGRYEESKLLATESLNDARENLGDISIVGMELFESIARSDLGLGNAEAAEIGFAESANVKTQHLGENHPLTLNAVMRQGDAFLALGRTDEARVAYERALKGRSQVFGAEHSETQAVLQRLNEL
jgi:serine/threonine-protein kinase